MVHAVALAVRSVAAQGSGAVIAVADPKADVLAAGAVDEELGELDAEFGRTAVAVAAADTHLAVKRAAVEVAADDQGLQQPVAMEAAVDAFEKDAVVAPLAPVRRFDPTWEHAVAGEPAGRPQEALVSHAVVPPASRSAAVALALADRRPGPGAERPRGWIEAGAVGRSEAAAAVGLLVEEEEAAGILAEVGP